MKKLQMSNLEMVNGSCGKATSYFAGAMCAAAILTGPLGAIMYGPSCAALAYACLKS